MPMSDSQLVLVRSLAFAGAVLFAFAAQRLRPHTRVRENVRVNVSLWALDAVVLAVVCGGCGFAVARVSVDHGWGLLAQFDAPPVVEVAIAILGLDLVSYWWHRANHVIPILWRFHQVHHSDERFAVTTGLRFHPGELLLSLPPRLAAIALLGISPLAVLAFEAVFAVANFFEHGDIALPARLERALGRFLVIPAYHRRHHSQQSADLGSNFSTVFVTWDRWFGTFRDSSSRDLYEIGLPGETCRELGKALLLPRRLLLGR